GKSIENNWQLLNSRVCTLVSPTKKAKFRNAIRLFTIWNNIDQYNINKLKQLNLHIAKIKAMHSSTGAKNAQSEITNSFEPILFLFISAHIILISNF
ncbi:22883_t:CDS:1, partial [Gigaspora rosea]